MSEPRPVPRNIDRPNRMAEYVVTFLAVYYSLMFMTHEALLAFGMAFLSVYFVVKLTANKPEGTAYRVWYRYFPIGKMFPNPKKAKKFEI